MENQNDRHHIIEITRNPEIRPSIPTTQTSFTGSKIHRVWTFFQLLVCVCQIIVSIIILWWSKIHESPEGIRFTWVVGYISGCLAMLPLIYFSYRIGGAMMNWFYVVVEVLKMALGCFFAVWFFWGNMKVVASSSKAERLDMLCKVLLKSGCIVNAIPAVGCFFLPRMISSAMAPRNLTGTATGDLFKALPTRADSFNALPTYRFKLKKNGTSAVGVLAAGTEQERDISGEDAACCICLEKYADNEELRELPCCHFFHKECVDEWLNINARCPLCQSVIVRVRTHGASTFANGPGQNPSERRTGNASAEGN